MLDMLRPTSGKIRIFGKEVQTNSLEIRRRCGYLPGNFSAWGNLSGKEFLHLCSNLRKVPDYIEPDLFDRFELSEKDVSRKISHLSHGTLQKLGIIQAFFHNPELLILDEPTIGLDPLMQEEFYDLLNEYQEKGSTIFLSSHNLSEVEKVCSRMAIIRKGELVKVESIENLKKEMNRKLIITLKHPIDNFRLSGVQLQKHHGLTYEYIVKENLPGVIKNLEDLPLADIIIPEPNLEDIFINLYKEQKDE